MDKPRAFTIPLEGAVLSGEMRAGRALAGRARGESPAFVFLHGFGGSLRTWDRLWAALPADAPLLRYDLRGFGASTGTRGLTFSHGDDLLALLDARGIARADLCGVSQGGAVALNFALDHPDRVGRLVLISPALTGWEWSDGWRSLWRNCTRAARAGNLDEARQLWWDHPFFAATRESDAAADLRASIDAFHGEQWVRDDQRPALPDVDRLHLLKTPCLLFSGARDYADFRLIADLLAATVPDLIRIDFPDGGHMLHLEKPAQLARAITDFMPSANDGAKL